MTPHTVPPLGPADRMALSPAELDEMRRASTVLLEAVQRLHADGLTLVTAVVAGEAFTVWSHYPPDDQIDPETGAQYYYHAHAPGDREVEENGHFHLFMTLDGPTGPGPAHLMALSVSPTGLPCALFTTNRWVTGGHWPEGRDALAALDRFVVAGESPHGAVNDFLTALVRLTKPAWPRLLAARDAALAGAGEDVFEDRAVEVLSTIDLDLAAWLELLEEDDAGA